MTFAECPREAEVIDALTTMQWPERCAEELKAHVAACEGCRDVVATMATLSEAWDETRAVQFTSMTIGTSWNSPSSAPR